jgi:hypothetical protein
MNDYDPSTGLIELLVGLRARGKTWKQIEDETAIDAERASQLVQEYLVSSYGASTVAEQRMLQLRRMEHVVNALWDQVMTGDQLTEGKQTKNLLDTLNMITELLDLKKDRVRDELVQLTRAQTDLVRTTLLGARIDILNSLLDMVQALPVKGTGEEVKATMRMQLEAGFSQMYADAATKALEGDHSTVIKVGSDGNKRYEDQKVVE